MNSQQQMKKKQKQLLLLRFLVLCSCLLVVFILFVSSQSFSLPSSKLHPKLAFSSDVSMMSSIVNLAKDFDVERFNTIMVDDRVLFPDHVMLLVASGSNLREASHCLYHRLVKDTFATQYKEILIKPVLSKDEYDEFRSILRCPLPPLDHSAEVELVRNEIGAVQEEQDAGYNKSILSWELMVYEAVLDGETVVVFVKGLNLRQGRVSDPAHFSCHFGINETFVLTTNAISAAQEVVRCELPQSMSNNLDKGQSVRVAIGVDQFHHGRIMNHTVLPSVAAISRSGLGLRVKKLDSRIVPLERERTHCGTWLPVSHLQELLES